VTDVATGERYDVEALRLERLARLQVVVTPDGCRVLCPYPFSATLLV
jgi:hypothetical protein